MKKVIASITCLFLFTVYSLACSSSYTIQTSPCVVGDVFKTDYCGQTWGARASGCAANPYDDPMIGFLNGGSVMHEVIDKGSYAYGTFGSYVYAKFLYFVRTTPGFNAGGVNYSYSAYFYFPYDCFSCPWDR